MNHRILAIDGGGIRGIIPARVLAHLEELTGQPTCRLFDFIAGTSTGGILALGLTAREHPDSATPKLSADRLAELYLEHGKRIFPKPGWRNIPFAGAIADVFEERYDADGLEDVLREYFGDAMLAESLTPVMVTAYEIELRTGFFFRSERAKARPGYDFPIREAARATSAAPTFFEPALVTSRTNESYALIDGGVFANNPGMCALTDARSDHPDRDVTMLSLGTGEHTRPIPIKDARRWGLAGWIRPVLSVMMDGMADSVGYQLTKMLPPGNDERRYWRLQTRLTVGNDDMDDASRTNMEALENHAKAIIENNRADLEALAQALAR